MMVVATPGGYSLRAIPPQHDTGHHDGTYGDGVCDGAGRRTGS